MTSFFRLLPALLLLESALARQTPEDLGFTSSGAFADVQEPWQKSFGREFCLDLGAKGFPLPVFNLLQQADWDPQRYFDELQSKGYAEDSLQLSGPKEAMLKSGCMRKNFHGRVKHIFVGDSQMMTLRNALHRLNGCPEIFYDERATEELNARRKSDVEVERGRLHSGTVQTPDERLPEGCKEDGIASFIYWDAWHSKLPVEEVKREMDLIGLDASEDTVVVWMGSNYIRHRTRLGVFSNSVQALHDLGVRMVWDTPTYQDVALMAATSAHDAGRDLGSRTPIVYTDISMRKARGEIGSNEFRDERKLLDSEASDIPMTKRWQLTNRYRGLQCDGIHTDMRGRDPMFFSQPCPYGPAPQYGVSAYCMWVEPFRDNLTASCPAATGVDDLVLQSGLFALCAGHERPFCYQYTSKIR